SIPPRQNEESSVSPHDFSVIPPPIVDDTGILTSTKSDLPVLANSKPRRERHPTKKKKIEGKTLVNELDSCLETSAKYMSSMPSADIAGILSSTKSGLPTLENLKPRQGRPPTKKKKFERQTRVSKPDSFPEASAKYMSSMPSDDIA
ncbi:hypothetical protein HAX54_030321, partial [Datura stramonium]|nr:hypothetical protein [Datura stramonium]